MTTATNNKPIVKKTNSGEWVNNCGQILVAKDTDRLYIKFNKDIVIKAGDVLTMEKNSDNIKKRLQKGFLTEAEAEELQEKTHFVKYVLHKGPSKS